MPGSCRPWGTCCPPRPWSLAAPTAQGSAGTPRPPRLSGARGPPVLSGALPGEGGPTELGAPPPTVLSCSHRGGGPLHPQPGTGRMPCPEATCLCPRSPVFRRLPPARLPPTPHPCDRAARLPGQLLMDLGGASSFRVSSRAAYERFVGPCLPARPRPCKTSPGASTWEWNFWVTGLTHIRLHQVMPNWFLWDCANLHSRQKHVRAPVVPCLCHGSVFSYIFIFFFLRFYLFIHERHRDREKQRPRWREKQALCGEPDAGLDPGTPGSWGHGLGWR